MKRNVFFLILFFAIFPAKIFANNDELNTVAEMGQLLNQESQNRVWPALNINGNPIIIYFKNKHNYAFNFTPINPGWKAINGQPRPVYSLDHDAYGINNALWIGSYPIDNQPSFIFNIDAFDGIGHGRTEAEHVLFHERFHMFQFESFPGDIWAYKTYDGFNNVENVKLTYLEDAALKNYLTTSDLEAIKDYAAINQYREKIMDSDSADYEAKKENLEGLADYYGWKMAISNSKERNNKIIDTYKNRCNLDELIRCQIHNRYYFTGTVVGLALDQLMTATWKKKLVENKFFIRKQLFQYYAMSDNQIQKRIADAKVKYHYDEITQPVEDAIKKYKQNRDVELKAYENKQGVIFNIEKMPCNRYGGIAVQKTYYFDSNTQLEIGSAGNSSCPDGSIQVNYLKTPYVLQIENIGEKQIKINSKIKMNIDGKSFEVGEVAKINSEIHFMNFSLTDPTIEIIVKNRRGLLKANNGVLYLITDFE